MPKGVFRFFSRQQQIKRVLGLVVCEQKQRNLSRDFFAFQFTVRELGYICSGVACGLCDFLQAGFDNSGFAFDRIVSSTAQLAQEHKGIMICCCFGFQCGRIGFYIIFQACEAVRAKGGGHLCDDTIPFAISVVL